MIQRLILKRFQYCAYVVAHLKKMEEDAIAQRLIQSYRFDRYARLRAELRDFEQLPRWFRWLRRMIAQQRIPLDTYAEEVGYRNRIAKKLKGLS